MITTTKAPVLPATGYLRLGHVLQLIPVGKTRWYAGIKTGEFPKPVSLGSRARGYRAEDIAALIERINNGQFGGVA